MRKVFASLLIASASSVALADNPAGCGLGTEIVFQTQMDGMNMF